MTRLPSLKKNLNLRTTDGTNHNIGSSTMVSDDIESRVLGIPGTGLGYYSIPFGDGILTSININHRLSEQFVIVQVYKTLTPFNQVECDVNLTDINNCELIFVVAPTTLEYTVVITG